jgi:hypothetical protein
MASARLAGSGRVLRYSSWDALLVALSIVHAAALLIVPSVPLIAIGLWWNANTIAHNFIHRPFFRARAANRAYALYLSVVLGLPQSIWRERHLAHHADRPVRVRWRSREVLEETTLVLAAWGTAVLFVPGEFVFVYLPGWALGLGLCWLQGYYEHASGTTSHYGRVYNFLFFNDGYHVEHHARPGQHWSRLRAHRVGARASRWPPVLRWLEACSLDGLERLVLRSPLLQRFVVRAHEGAFRRLLPLAGDVRSVTVVGGGLFPRTALVLRRLLPDATLVVLDANAAHLEAARTFLDDAVVLRHALYRGTELDGVDLVVVPLAYLGNRRNIYERPPARAALVHDWIWSSHGRGAIISPWLLKRLNLITAPPAATVRAISRSA